MMGSGKRVFDDAAACAENTTDAICSWPIQRIRIPIARGVSERTNRTSTPTSTTIARPTPCSMLGISSATWRTAYETEIVTPFVIAGVELRSSIGKKACHDVTRIKHRIVALAFRQWLLL